MLLPGTYLHVYNQSMLGLFKHSVGARSRISQILRVLFTVISKVHNRWGLGLSQMAFFSLNQDLVRLSQTL